MPRKARPFAEVAKMVTDQLRTGKLHDMPIEETQASIEEATLILAESKHVTQEVTSLIVQLELHALRMSKPNASAVDKSKHMTRVQERLQRVRYVPPKKEATSTDEPL